MHIRSGAVAMRSLDAGEVMHPGVGPLVEANQLYVKQSRLGERLVEGDIVLFDIGLGAGSNASAARTVAEEAQAGQLTLVSFERDLGALTLALTQADAFGLDAEAARALLQTHRHQGARTDWQLRHGDLLPLLAQEKARADLIYWDPFSPRANPTLWTVAAFTAARRVAGPRCLLVTYSASTATRAALLLAGWHVGIGAAIGTKEQTTVAATQLADLAQPLARSWLSRIQRPDAVLPADAPPDARSRILSAPQFSV